MAARLTEISIEVSHRCSLECLFCSSSATAVSPTGELSLPEIAAVLDDAERLGATRLSISGGEPLMYPHVLDVVRIANVKGMSVSVYTSGIRLLDNGKREPFPDEVWRALDQAVSPRHPAVVFDLQGPVADVVDRLMVCEGAFAMITESIRRARCAGLTCEAHMVPMKPNYRLIPATVALAEELGLTRLSFLRFVPQGRAANNAETLCLDRAEFRELQQILLALKESERLEDRAIEIRLGCPIDFLFLLDASYPAQPCRGGRDAPLVLPDGSVHMCPAWKDLKHLSPGNIREQPLRDIWSSTPFYQQFRQLLQHPSAITGECRECASLTVCKGGCTAQRILAHGPGRPLAESLYLSPDPLCPLATGAEQPGRRTS